MCFSLNFDIDFVFILLITRKIAQNLYNVICFLVVFVFTTIINDFPLAISVCMFKIFP